MSTDGSVEYTAPVTSQPAAGDSYVAGTVLDGKYAVERVIGRGATGVVLLAKHLELGEQRALKVLHPWLTDPARVERFKLEARAAVKLKSDHVARVFDVGTLPTGAPYIVMEHLEGCDLAEYLRARGRLDVAEAVGLVLQACEALDEAHRVGIVHRDLKPANLFVHRRADGRTLLKLLDFGVAKVRVSPSTMSATDAGTVVGTPRYMAPEQARASANVDLRADVWALGVILYELVTGRPAFDAASIGELTSKLLHETPRSPRELRPDLPAAVAAATMRCLQKAPELRFDSVRALSAALAPVRQGNVGQRPAAPPSTATAGALSGSVTGPSMLALAGAFAGALVGTSISYVRAAERAAEAAPSGAPSSVPAASQPPRGLDLAAASSAPTSPAARTSSSALAVSPGSTPLPALPMTGKPRQPTPPGPVTATSPTITMPTSKGGADAFGSSWR